MRYISLNLSVFVLNWIHYSIINSPRYDRSTWLEQGVMNYWVNFHSLTCSSENTDLSKIKQEWFFSKIIWNPFKWHFKLEARNNYWTKQYFKHWEVPDFCQPRARRPALWDLGVLPPAVNLSLAFPLYWTSRRRSFWLVNDLDSFVVWAEPRCSTHDTLDEIIITKLWLKLALILPPATLIG